MIQLQILEKEDENRLNSRYKYIRRDIKVLVSTKITDSYNEKEYEKYKEIIIDSISILYDIIQNPKKEGQINKIENILFCNTEYFTNKSNYYYSKLYEYWNNKEKEMELLQHFKNRIKPFNNNISNIKELYCLVKAFNYLKKA